MARQPSQFTLARLMIWVLVCGVIFGALRGFARWVVSVPPFILAMALIWMGVIFYRAAAQERNLWVTLAALPVVILLILCGLASAVASGFILLFGPNL